MHGIRALAVLLALLLAACGRDPAAVDSGVEGIVLLGPQCPVVMEGSPCPDLPVAAEVRATDPDTGETVATTRSGEDGRFRLPLPPGHYVVVAESLDGDGGLPFGKPLDIVVGAQAFTEVTLSLDTGIR